MSEKAGTGRMRRLLSINPETMVYDIVVLLYSEFFLNRFATGGRLIDILGIDGLFIAGIAVDFFVIWYLGAVISSYWRNAGDDKWENLRQMFLLTLVWFLAIGIIAGLHMGMFINIVSIRGANEVFVDLFTYSFAMLFLGIANGVVFASSEHKRALGHDPWPDRFESLKIFVPLGIWPINIYVIYHVFRLFRYDSIAAGAIVWVLLMGLEYLTVFLLERRARRKQAGGGPVPKPDTLFQRLVFPLIVVTMLCLWNDIYIQGKIARAVAEKESISAAGMVFYAFIAGLLPMRILMAFRPPFSPAGFVMGAVALYWYLSSLIGLAANTIP